MDKIELPNEVLLPEVEAILDEGRDVILMTKGCSMLPHIRGGKDSVRLVRCTEPQVGDIVLARVLEGDRYVLHRILAINSGTAVLMGDGNLAGTEHCPLGSIHGRAVEAIGPWGLKRKLGKGKIWVKLLAYRKFLLRCYKFPGWIIRKIKSI